MPADLRALTCTATNSTGSELLLKWKDLTYDLVAYGYAAELYQELDNRTHREDHVGAHVPQPTCSRREEPSHPSHLAKKLNFNTNDVAIHDVLASNDDTSSVSSFEESESDRDIYDDMVVPFDLVDDAVDLSQYYSTNLPLSFEQIFAQERLATLRKGGHQEVEEVPDHFNANQNILSSTPLPSLNFPVSTSEPTQILPSSASEFPERDYSGGELGQGFGKEMEPIAWLPISSAPRRKSSRKSLGLRLSDKRNLTPAAIPVVAELLVSPDAISYFLSQCRSIYESWMPSSTSDSPNYSCSIETRVVAALDRVQDLLDGKRICRLLLRFAYLQLAWSVDAYKAVAAADRVQHKGKRKVGHRDTTVAITLYLETKRKVSGKEVPRNRLLGHCRTGRRLTALAGRAPLLVFILSEVADTIMYVLLYPLLVETHDSQRQNNSITESIIRALAARIEQNHTELIRSLMSLGKYAGLTSTHAVGNVPPVEDIVAETHRVLSTTLIDTIT